MIQSNSGMPSVSAAKFRAVSLEISSLSVKPRHIVSSGSLATLIFSEATDARKIGLHGWKTLDQRTFTKALTD